MTEIVKVEGLSINLDSFAPLIEEMDSALKSCSSISQELAITDEDLKTLDYDILDNLTKELNKSIKEADDLRKKFKSKWTAPQKAVESAFKKELSDIELLRDRYTAERSSRQQGIVQERKTAVFDYFCEFMEANGVGSLIGLIDIEELLSPVKIGYAKNWSEKKAQNEVEDIAGKFLADWRTVQNTQFYFPEEAQKEFLYSLSIQNAIEADNQRHKQDMAFKEVQAEQRLNEEFRNAPMPEPMPEPVQEPVIHDMAEQEFTYILTLTMTESKKSQLINTLRQLDIHGTIRKEQ